MGKGFMKRIPVKIYKRPRKRFKSDAQIMEVIDACHSRSKLKMAKAEAVDRQADEAFSMAARESDNVARMKLAGYAQDLRNKAVKLRVSATRLIEVRAKKLGERLSEFRTGLLPCHGVGDATVPML